MCFNYNSSLCLIFLFYDRERWWVLWLMTVSTCGTWDRRDQPSFTPSSSTERGKSLVWPVTVFILLPHVFSLSFSSPSSVRPSHLLWCNVNCDFLSRSSATFCCLCELLVFTAWHTVCKQTAFHLATVSVRLQKLCTGQKRWQGGWCSLSLSLVVSN